MRRLGIAAPGLLIVAILLLVGMTGAAPAAARQGASPAAGTPAAPPVATAAPQPAATAAPTQPAAAAATPAVAQTNVVTLVLWYANAANQDILELYPLATDAGFVAGPQPGAAAVGSVDFPLEGEGVPTIVLGETTFASYPRADGTIERWTWFDDFEGARPASLVLQVAATGGAYQDYYGAATFVSRDEGGAGGVLTIVLRPPSPAAAAGEEAAADQGAEAPAEQPVAEAGTGGEAAVQPDATIEPPTVILPEPAPDGGAPAGEGGAPAAPPA
jgi:hypothetical protein